jgi:SepF-like predicted cell division protein (DUF552 family)
LRRRILGNINLGKVIDRIVSKVKKDKEPQIEKPFTETPITQAPEPVPEQVLSSTPPPPKTVYLKTSTLNSLEELDKIKGELETGNIAIIRLTPLFDKDLDDVKRAVRKLKKIIGEIDGDIASLGEDRIVVTPSHVKIWREEDAKHKRRVKESIEAE